LFDGTQGRSKIALYVRRVLIMQESEDLLPSWLRFVRGVVDSNDLPLNVSREVLQSDAKVRAIGKRLVKRVLDALEGVMSADRVRYARFWRNFGVCLKEGIWFGADDDGRIAKLCLFESTRGESGKDADLVSLDEYVARMPQGQEGIWYLTGNDRLALSHSPHLEGPTKRGEEVLFLVDPIDEWVVQRLTEWSGKKLVALDRRVLEEDAAAKEAREALDREHRDALGMLEGSLAKSVKSVRFTTRLEESPAVLVSDESNVSPHMARILRASNQEVPQEKRILELNAMHPLVQRLLAAAQDPARRQQAAELGEVLHGQAVLAEGGVLEDPGRFAKLLARLLA
jgi:molecular chaperone HtpG